MGDDHKHQLSDAERKKLREELNRIRWKNAHDDNCLNCGSKIRVPLMGSFECTLCQAEFFAASSELIGHHEFEIDPEKGKDLEILGVLSIIIGRVGEDYCGMCGETYPKGSICPYKLDFAIHYYCEPEEKRLPQTRDRVAELLLKHDIPALDRLRNLRETNADQWKKVCASGLLDRLQSMWGTI